MHCFSRLSHSRMSFARINSYNCNSVLE
uniref:Uncharacterized protein n=1 Tax=Arundo donax TaxID=35708 RepID=A0A0A8YE77_ARUDO